MSGPLAGVSVLDLTLFAQGSAATGILSDLGADVVKIERPGIGDPGRRLTEVAPGVSTFFEPLNRGKRSIAVDIATDAGRAVVLRLAAASDVFVHNFRPGVLERRGLGYEDVRSANSRIVYAHGTGFGSNGPDAGHGVVDIVGQARGGLISVTGEEHPVPAGAIVSDYVGGMHLAIAILSALSARSRTGAGQRVEASMLGSMVAMQGWEFTHYLVTGELPRRSGRGHQLFWDLWGVFETRDGFLAMAGVPEAAWGEFLALIARTDLGADPRFATPAARRERSAELAVEVRRAVRERDTDPLLAELLRIGVRCSRVQNYEQLARDPQVLANAYVEGVEHPVLGPVRMSGRPVSFSASTLSPLRAAPRLGEHTGEVLREAGYGPNEIDTLRDQGVVAIDGSER